MFQVKFSNCKHHLGVGRSKQETIWHMHCFQNVCSENCVRKQRGRRPGGCSWKALPGPWVLGQGRRVFTAWNLVCAGLASRPAAGKRLRVGPWEAPVNREPGGDGRLPDRLSSWVGRVLEAQSQPGVDCRPSRWRERSSQGPGEHLPASALPGWPLGEGCGDDSVVNIWEAPWGGGDVAVCSALRFYFILEAALQCCG